MVRSACVRVVVRLLPAALSCVGLPSAEASPPVRSASAGGAAPSKAPSGREAMACGARVVFSEIHYDPDRAPDRELEFVEIYNAGTQPAAVFSLILIDARGRRHPLVQGGVPLLEPGGVLLIGPAARGPRSITLGRLSLPNSEGSLRLEDACGNTLDVAIWKSRRPWPRHRPGRSIERRAPDCDGARPVCWVATSEREDAGDRATPGRVRWHDRKPSRRPGACEPRPASQSATR